MLLDAAFVARVRAGFPLPIADAVNALASAEDLHEERDRLVEAFRAALRYAAALALAARVQYEATAPKPQLVRLLDQLASRGLTDGQWYELVRVLLAPHEATPDAHPLPALVRAFVARGGVAPSIDALLAMRKAETVAHGTTGDADELAERLPKRAPHLVRFLEALEPIWSDGRLVVPRARPHDGERQSASLLMGITADRGRWVRIGLADGVDLPPGEPVIVDAAGRPKLALAPIALARRPTPDRAEALFFLDGCKGTNAVYVALPSAASLVAKEVELRRVFGDPAVDEPAVRAAAIERPFRGLESFGREHADLFFGREELVEHVANSVRQSSCVIVTGPSGAGKSSLVHAGVCPALESSRGGAWHVVSVRPGLDGELGLLRQLAKAAGEGVSPAMAELLPALAGNWLIVVDQAEEILTSLDATARDGFVRTLVELTANSSVRVLLSVREDFAVRIGALPHIADLFARSGSQVIVGPPDRDALVRTLIGPLRLVGYRFEDDELIEAMVAPVIGNPAALVLLQFIADQMWTRRDTTWKRLTRAAYEALAGVEGALAQHAETCYSALTPGQQRVMRAILERLIRPDGTRELVPVSELSETLPDARSVLERLVSARLVVVRDSEESGRCVEIIHEALAHHWTRFKQWHDEDPHGARLHEALRIAARSWHQRGRPRAQVWRGELLGELRAWQKRADPLLGELEEAFVEASDRERVRARGRQHLVAAAFAVLALGVVVALLYGLREAHRERDVARVNAEAAQRAEGKAKRSAARANEARTLAELREAEASADAQLAEQRPDVALAWLGRTHFSFANVRRAYAAMERGSSFVLGGHYGSVRMMAWSPDGKRIAAGSSKGIVTVWDVGTGAERELVGHTGVVRGLAWMPSSAILATGDDAGQLFVWNADTGARRELVGCHKMIASLAFSPDGILASGSGDGIVRLWDPVTGAHHDVPIGASINYLSWSRDGRLAIAADDREIRIYDPKSRTLRVVASASTRPTKLHTIAWSPDGKLVAVGTNAGEVVVADASTGGMTRLAAARSDEIVFSLAWSPSGAYLAWGGQLGGVHVADRATWKIRDFAGHDAWISRAALAWGTDTTFYTGSGDTTIGVWRLDSEVSRKLHGHRDAVRVAAISPDGTTLATAGDDGFVRLWPTRGIVEELSVGPSLRHIALRADDLTIAVARDRGVSFVRGDRVTSSAELGAPAKFVAYASDGRLAAADDAGTITIVERSGTLRELPKGAPVVATAWSQAGELAIVRSTGELVVVPPAGDPVTLATISDAPTTLAWSRDGAQLAVGTAVGAIALVARDGRTPVRVLKHRSEAITTLAFSPDGKILATGSARTPSWNTPTIYLWNLATSTPEPLDANGGAVTTLAFSPDGKTLAATIDEHTLRLLDIATGQSRVFSGHTGNVTSLAWSPDSAMIATGGTDRSVRLWDVATGGVMVFTRGAEICDLAWSPDGAMLVIASIDGWLARVPFVRDEAQYRAFVDGRTNLEIDPARRVETAAFRGLPWLATGVAHR